MTQEDLLEEIVGELYSEYDEPDWIRRSCIWMRTHGEIKGLCGD